MPTRHVQGRNSLRPFGRSRLHLEALEERAVLSTSYAPSLGDYAQDHILVRFHSGQNVGALPGTSLGARVDTTSHLYKVQLGAGVSVEQALAGYRADARVQLAEPDYQLGTTALPSDARFSEQWSLRNTGQSGGKAGADIKATQAWDVTTGSTRMIVSVMDSGVDYTHPDLYRNIWINQAEIPASRRSNLLDLNGDGLITFHDLNDPRNQGVGKIMDLNGNGYIDAGDLLKPMTKDASGKDTGRGGWANGISEDGDQFVDDLVGWNFAKNTNDPFDDLGHGTHVSGTIGASGNNGVGVSGVTWAVQLMPIKFLTSSGAGSVSSFIAGLNYAVSKGAKISNNSWTGAGESSLLTDAIQNARARSHIFVAAAGNHANNNDTSPTYPASFRIDNVVAVAASDRNDQLAAFSNYGSSSVRLAAPGVDILSTTVGGGYGFNSGTSMATPHVAGALALVWSANPGWSYTQVINRVLNTVDKVASLSGKTSTGGRLNVAAAIGSPATATPSSAGKITAASWSGSSTSNLNRVRVTFDRAMLVSTFSSADVRLTGPNGQTITASSVQVVAGSSNRTFDIHFAQQTAAGTYQMSIGPEVMDTNQVKMAVWSGSYTLTPPVSTPVTQAKITAASWSGSSTSNLNRVRVTFDRAMLVSTFSSADVRLTGPNGQTITASSVQVVAGSSNRTFDIHFAQQTAAGTYQMSIGPEVMDTNQVKMAVWSGSYTLTPPVSTPVTQAKITAASWSGSSTSNLNRVRVTFDRAMLVSTFSSADVRLTGPNGQTITASSVQVVAGSSNRTFDIHFAQQTAAGTYQMSIGPEVMDTNQVKMAVWSGSYTLTPPVSTPVTQAKITAASWSGSSTSNLNRVRVTFDRAMLVSTFSSADVRLTGPNGQTITASSVQVVAGSSNRTFDIHFAQQTAAGTYQMSIGPEVMDTNQVKMAVWSGSYTLTPPVSTPVTQAKITAASWSGSSTSNLNRVRVTFDRAMLVSTFSSADVRLTGPNGQTITASSVQVVAGSSNRTFDIHFAQQTAAGTYQMSIGPEVMDTNQVKMAVWSGSYTLTPPVSTPVTQAKITAASWSGSSTSNLNRVRVTFDRAMLVSTFSSADVRLTGPNGQTITASSVQVVAGTSDRTFDIHFAQQTAAGTYQMSIGPEVMDTNQVKMAVWSGSYTLTPPVSTPVTQAKITAASWSGSSTSNLNRVRVTFDRAMLVSTFSSADVRLTGPNGQTITASSVQVVAGTSDRTFDIHFAQQTAAGTYQMSIGPEVMDTNQVKMAVWSGSYTLQAAVVSPATRTYTSSTRVAITPNGRAVSLLTINDDITIADVDIRLNITHPRTSDLYIHLQAPDGTNIVLFNRMGGGTADMINLVFDDQAAVHIGLGRGPFTGSYQPISPLSNLLGKNAKGTWKLWVQDRNGVNSGTINNWSVIIKPRTSTASV